LVAVQDSKEEEEEREEEDLLTLEFEK